MFIYYDDGIAIFLLNRKKTALNYLFCLSSVVKAKSEREEGTTGDAPVWRLMALGACTVYPVLCTLHSYHLDSLMLLWKMNVLFTFDSLILEVDYNRCCG